MEIQCKKALWNFTIGSIDHIILLHPIHFNRYIAFSNRYFLLFQKKIALVGIIVLRILIISFYFNLFYYDNHCYTLPSVSNIFSFIQSPLTSLRTYDVTHSRFVRHFRILKIQMIKIFNFFIVAHIRFIVYFLFKKCFEMVTYLSISLNFV